MKQKLKNVCITGSGNGIGKSIAIMLNKHGYNVACVDISLKDAQKTLSEFTNKDNKGISILGIPLSGAIPSVTNTSNVLSGSRSRDSKVLDFTIQPSDPYFT